MYKIQWRPELPNLRCSLCAGGFRLVSQLVPWLANSTLVYLQKRMRGISHSSLLLASSANQILPRFFRFLYIFDMFDNGLGFMDAFWLKRQINWSNALILALVLSLPDSSMGSRVSLPWTAPCWQSSWPKRGKQSLPVMVIIKLEIRWYATYMVLWLWVENTQGIKFGHHFSDHMLTVAWEQGRGWVWFS